jgi:hypothetical protein
MMSTLRITTVLIVFLCAIGCGGNSETTVTLEPFDFSYPYYSRVLSIGVQGNRVDYQRLKTGRADLDSTIDRIASADLSNTGQNERMAFYINAYNAITLRSVIDNYPVESMQEIDGVWDKKTWLVAGDQLTLNEIEHDILREQFSDPRIHSAVNCAAIGCPPLRRKPYLPDSLDRQLEAASMNFSQSMEYNRLLPDKKKAELSSIFDWYGKDYIAQYFRENRYPKLSDKENAALSFIIEHNPEPIRKELEEVEFEEVTYLEYDWSLNDAR